jgi:glycosyltransferase involved in cell wall biosynthesis
MGYGLPVITHGDRRHHNPEIVALRNGWNGFEFTAGDGSDMARCIQAVANDAALRKEMGANARATALDEFSVQRMAERFCEAVSFARRTSLTPGNH